MEEQPNQFLQQLGTVDRLLLQLSIHMNPLMVANADGCCSLRESSAIANTIHELLRAPEYRCLVMVAGPDSLSDAALRVMLDEHSKDVGAYVARLATILNGIPQDVALAYRRFTLFAIIQVAEASRDGFFGLVGARISESERAVMRQMINGLGLIPNDDERDRLGL